MELSRPWGRDGRWVIGKVVGGCGGEEDEGSGGARREGHGQRRRGRRARAKKADGPTNHARRRLCWITILCWIMGMSWTDNKND